MEGRREAPCLSLPSLSPPDALREERGRDLVSKGKRKMFTLLRRKRCFVKCHLSVTCVDDMAELSWLWTPVQSILFSQLGLARALQFRHGLRAASLILT